MNHDEDAIVRRLRRALEAEAEMVHPDQRGLGTILERIEAEERSRRRPWLPWAGALVAAAVAGIVAGIVLTSDGPDAGQPAATPTVTDTSGPVTAEPTTPPPTTAPATTAPPAAGTLTGIPVYWVGQPNRDFALFREFRDVPDAGGPIASAVAAMTREKPLDPDYTTPWRPASRVEVSRDGSNVTVDLSADAFANTNVGSALAELAVQQLVYTATAAAQTGGTPASTVTVTVDGEPYDAWGTVRLGEPMQRASQVEVQSHAWVLSPTQGATVPAGTVTFKGFGTSFEANFVWRIATESGAEVAKGFATGGTGTGGFGEFTFTADLAPGSYTVEVSTDDPSGGAEGPGAATDDKAFTVR